MKTILVLIALAIGAAACTPSANYKTERDEVMKYHDTVMQGHAQVVNNQLKLDTLLRSLSDLKRRQPQIDTLKEKVTMNETLVRLHKAEGLMNKWMQEFEPDITGKSEAAALAYFKAEQVKIAAIDSIYKSEINLSTNYLLKFRQ